MDYTIDKALVSALNDAQDKADEGKLIPSALWKDSIHSDGGFETVYSIISLYSDDENDDGTWEKTIRTELEEIYPTYF